MTNLFEQISLVSEETNHRPGAFAPLISRICQAARDKLRNSNDGLAVVTVKVLVNKDGQPVLWAEPNCVKLEPAIKAAAFFEAMS